MKKFYNMQGSSINRDVLISNFSKLTDEYFNQNYSINSQRTKTYKKVESQLMNFAKDSRKNKKTVANAFKNAGLVAAGAAIPTGAAAALIDKEDIHRFKNEDGSYSITNQTARDQYEDSMSMAKLKTNAAQLKASEADAALQQQQQKDTAAKAKAFEDKLNAEDAQNQRSSIPNNGNISLKPDMGAGVPNSVDIDGVGSVSVPEATTQFPLNLNTDLNSGGTSYFDYQIN